jgi:hypothetical protein
MIERELCLVVLQAAVAFECGDAAVVEAVVLQQQDARNTEEVGPDVGAVGGVAWLVDAEIVGAECVGDKEVVGTRFRDAIDLEGGVEYGEAGGPGPGVGGSVGGGGAKPGESHGGN